MSLIHVSYPSQWLFKEADYISAVLTIQRAQEELNTLARQLIRQIPNDGRLRYFPNTYNLNAYTLAHILERHYLPGKHPGASKFLVTVPEIARLIRVGFKYPAFPTGRRHMHRRVFSAGRIIGIDLNGKPSSLVEVITDAYGYIKSAYPALYDATTSIQARYQQAD